LPALFLCLGKASSVARPSQLGADMRSARRAETRHVSCEWHAAGPEVEPVLRFPGLLTRTGREWPAPGSQAILPGGLDRLDRGLHAKLHGQRTDLGFGVAAMAAQGLHEGQLALLGPTRHGLGRHRQDLGHLGGPQVAGRGACGLAAGLGCHGASLRSPDPGSCARPGVDRLFTQPPREQLGADGLLDTRRQKGLSPPDQASHHSPFGRFQRPARRPRLSPGLIADRQTSWANRGWVVLDPIGSPLLTRVHAWRIATNRLVPTRPLVRR
jgi:hypothetical protein